MSWNRIFAKFGSDYRKPNAVTVISRTNYRDVIREVNSYGNGLTAPHPITSAEDAKALIWLLSESVAQRMREDGVQARTVSVGVRSDVDLTGYGCQAKLPRPSAATRHVASAAWAMLASRERFGEDSPVRAVCTAALLGQPSPPMLQLPARAVL